VKGDRPRARRIDKRGRRGGGEEREKRGEGRGGASSTIMENKGRGGGEEEIKITFTPGGVGGEEKGGEGSSVFWRDADESNRKEKSEWSSLLLNNWGGSREKEGNDE